MNYKMVIIILIAMLALVLVSMPTSESINITEEVNITVNNITKEVNIIEEVNITNSNITEEVNIIEEMDYSYLLQPKGILKDQSFYRTEGDCELIAKQFRKEHGGNLIFIAPFIDGNVMQGEYAGEWINQIVVNNTTLYINYGQKYTTDSSKAVIFMAKEGIRQKLNNNRIEVRMYVMGIDRIDFPMIWNFGEV